MNSNTEPMYLDLADINVDPACQTRAAMDDTVVDEYLDIMKEESDDSFPPVVVFYDGTKYWLSDGFHRHAAAQKAGLRALKVEIRPGHRRDAILHAVGANATHGLRRTNSDKRRAVTILLEDEEWRTWSNREIARRCGVDEGLVRRLDRELKSLFADRPQIPRTVKRNGTVFEMQTSNIGRKIADAEDVSDVLLFDSDTGNSTESGVLPQPDLTRPGKSAGPAKPVMALVGANGGATETDTGIDAQVDALLVAWDRAGTKARAQFLDLIDAVPVPPTSETADQEPVKPDADNCLLDRLIAIWSELKPNTQQWGRYWVANGCPADVDPREHASITGSLEPFRAAARAAGADICRQFLDYAETAAA